MDAVTAFLQEELSESVSIEAPAVINIPDGHVLTLNKAIYD